MNSRMERYSSEVTSGGRLDRNKRLYDEVSDMNIDYIDINVDNAVSLDNFGGTTNTRRDYQLRKELGSIMPNSSRSDTLVSDYEKREEEEKVYDINEILKLARENKLFQDQEKRKRLINTEYNILTKLDINEIDKKDDYSKESLRKLIDEIYEKEKKPEVRPKKRRRIENDLLADLTSDDFEINADISGKILEKDQVKKEEIKKQELEEKNKKEEVVKEDKSDELYTKISDTKALEENETSDIDFEEEFKSGKGLLIFVILLVVVLLAAGGYIYYKYFM